MSRYEVVEVLARGQAATTTRILDTLTGQTRIEKRTSLKDKTALHLARQEADLLLKLDGNGAPILHGVKEEDGFLVLHQEDVKGRVPETRRERKEAVQNLVRLFKTIHRFGYVYLDLKPEHVLTGPRGLVLVDYNGIERLHTKLCLFATPSRMPPELKKGEPVTEKADTYVLGRLCQDWHLYPWKRRRCLNENPAKRPDLDVFRPWNPLPFLFVLLSVFASAFVPLQRMETEKGPDWNRPEQAVRQLKDSDLNQLAKEVNTPEQACLVLEAWLDSDQAFAIPASWSRFETDPAYAALKTICEHVKKGIET